MEGKEGSNGVANGGSWGRDSKFFVANSRIIVDGHGKQTFGSLQVELADGIDDDFKLIHAYAGYKFSETMIQAGRFKVPIGIDHLTPSVEWDLAEESVLTSHLTHGWKDGLMFAGDIIGNLSYNLAYFTSSYFNSRGLDNAYAARLMFDHGNLHVEAAYAAQENNMIVLSTPPPVALRTHRDFSTKAFGIAYDEDQWIFKTEYILGSNVVLANPNLPTGVTSDIFDMDTLYFHFAYSPVDYLELMGRHYRSVVESTQLSVLNYKSTMTNTYLGIKIIPEKNYIFQINYIWVNGDDRSTPLTTNGGPFPAIEGGRTADTLVLLALLMF